MKVIKISSSFFIYSRIIFSSLLFHSDFSQVGTESVISN